MKRLRRDERRSVSPPVIAAMLIAVAVTGPAAAGCADVARARGMARAKESPAAVARAVLDAIERRSERGLRKLLVTRDEHRDLLWPHLPERGTLPFGYVRKLNRHNTTEGIDAALRTYGGAELELIRVEFQREPEHYDDFTLHKGARVWVRRASDGEKGYIEILDVLVEWNGRWKPFNYRE